MLYGCSVAGLSLYTRHQGQAYVLYAFVFSQICSLFVPGE